MDVREAFLVKNTTNGYMKMHITCEGYVME